MTVLPVLLALIRARVAHPTYDWLRDTVDEIRAPFDARAFRTAWSRVGRRLGSQLVTPTLEEAGQLRLVGLWPFVAWGADECGRAALLLQAAAVMPFEAQGLLIDGLYLRGTIRERQALLRILAFLPEPERFEEVAEQASRTHVVSVFEALAVGNPYPVRHLSRARFDEMVLRALALRVSPERIVGLSERLSTELTRSRPPAGPRWGPESTRVALRAP